MRDARKLFRLFKTVNEIKKILDFLHAKGPMTSDTILNILVRLAFAGYWLFDNLSILAKIKIIGLDAKKMGQVGASFWLTALFINLVSIAKDIVVNLKYIDRLQRFVPIYSGATTQLPKRRMCNRNVTCSSRHNEKCSI